MCKRAVLLGLLAGLLWAVPANAFTPPTLYVRLAHANSIDHSPAGDWLPLADTPHLNWLGGYEIGYVFEDSPAAGASQHAALQITGVPDGQPTQPQNTPYCLGGPGTVGTITPVGVEIQFEGTGTYSVSVSVGPATGGRNDCMGGAGSATSTGSFFADGSVAPAAVGGPLVYRDKPLKGANAFAGVRAPIPPGGDGDTRCARDAKVNADGSVSGKLMAPQAISIPLAQIPEDAFKRPGDWTCVSRGSIEGRNDALDDLIFATPWSAPLHVDVRSDFRRAHGVLSKPHSSHPVLTFTAEFPEAAPGGIGTLKIKRLARCRRHNYVLAAAGTFKGRFDAKGREAVTINRLPSNHYYLGTLSFSGTRFYTKSVDPNPVLLQVTDTGALEYVPSNEYPQC